MGQVSTDSMILSNISSMMDVMYARLRFCWSDMPPSTDCNSKHTCVCNMSSVATLCVSDK